jgi:hypothetical protein
MTVLAVICARTLSFFGDLAVPRLTLAISPLCSRSTRPWIETRFSRLAARLRKSEPPAFQKRAVSGQNATAFLPSIPNGGVD